MKVLLAPLFFKQRMCKHGANLFYRKNPGRWAGIHEFESLPPLGSFDRVRGFVPDLPALLMFDEFILDGEAHERLKNRGDRHWLREWTELLDGLESEGVLSVSDVKAAAAARPNHRGWMLRRDLARPERWWQAMGYYDSLLDGAQRFLGDDPASAQDYAWQFDPEAAFGLKGSDGKVHYLSVVLGDGGSSESMAHRELYSAAVQHAGIQLREVNACLTACDELGVAPMMWAPYRRYLEQKVIVCRHSRHGSGGDAVLRSRISGLCSHIRARFHQALVETDGLLHSATRSARRRSVALFWIHSIRRP